jgi:hypothetical protein
MPQVDLACRLRRSFRAFCLPTSSESQQSLLPSTVTTGTHATWMAITLSGTSLYAFVIVWSQCSATLAVFMQWMSCSMNSWCASKLSPSKHVTCILNCVTLALPHIFAISFSRRGFCWPHQGVNCAPSIVPESNCSRCRLSHWILFAVYFSHFVMA